MNRTPEMDRAYMAGRHAYLAGKRRTGTFTRPDLAHEFERGWDATADEQMGAIVDSTQRLMRLERAVERLEAVLGDGSTAQV